MPSASKPVADSEAAMENLNALVERVKQSQKLYAKFSQSQVDDIFRAAALAAADARIPLAKMAATESGMGVAEDKVIKNHFASGKCVSRIYHTDHSCDESSSNHRHSERPFVSHFCFVA